MTTITRENAGALALAKAEELDGKPYVWGAESVNADDCSGLVQLAYKDIGIELPRTTYDQCRVDVLPSGTAYEPGDLLFFVSEAEGPGHVVFYVSEGRAFEAPHTGANIGYYPYDPAQIIVATRPALSLPAEPVAEQEQPPAPAEPQPVVESETPPEEAAVESAASAQEHQVAVDTSEGKFAAARAVYAKLLVHIQELGDLFKS